MIVLNGLIFHTTLITLSLGMIALRHTNQVDAVPAWKRVFQPFEGIQIIVFSGQETLI